MSTNNRTIALIKSQAIRDGHANAIILAILGGDGPRLSLEAAERMHLTRAQAEAFYGEHAGRPYFEGLIDSVTGPEGVIALELKGDHLPDGLSAIKVWRDLMGPTDPIKARETAPDTIRARYATEMPHTAVHGSDSPEAVDRERAILWPDALSRAGAACGTVGSIWRHKERGSEYRIVARGRLQVDGPLDMAEVVIYQETGDGLANIWVRPTTDFFDGRFEKVADA